MSAAQEIQVRRGAARVVGAFQDSMAVAWRNLTALRRVPQYIVFSTIQPIIFVLMFRYVFGGSINVGQTPYVDYLMPGIFVQTAVFGSMGSAIGLAVDIKSGLLERFQSLPMARSAVLAGRTAADLGRNVFVASLMTAVGFAVGFRIHTNALAFLAAIGLLLLFGYVFSWVFATLGLVIKDPESAQAAAFPLMAPLVFASSAFVDPSRMAGWLEPFARHQPVSVTISAIRALCIGGPTATHVWRSLAWLVGLIVIFAPIAVNRYRKAL